VTLIHLDDRSPTSLSLSWTPSRRPPAHINHRYELMYRRKVSRCPLCSFAPSPPPLPSFKVEAANCSKIVLIHPLSFPQDDEGERDVTTYTVLILEKGSVQINDLTPDTTYMFRVQALSPEGHPGSYSVEHEFLTAPLGTSSCNIYNT